MPSASHRAFATPAARAQNSSHSSTLLTLSIAGVLAVASVSARAEMAAASEEVLVTAHMLEQTVPQELAKYGSRLTTITAEQITAAGTIDVAQTLQQLAPGLYISAKNGPFDYVDVSLQGSRKSDILWLVDGMRVNNRLYAGTTPLDTLPAHMVERIEILEGAQGLMYGTQAVAGVINVVTRSFTEDNRGEAGVGVDSQGGQHLHGTVSDALAGHQWVVYGSHDKSDGYEAFRDQDYQPSATDRKRGYDVTTLGAKYAYDFSSAVRLSATYQHTDADLDFARPTLNAYTVNARDEDMFTVKLDIEASDQVALFFKGYFHDWDTLYTRYYNVLSGGAITSDLSVVNEGSFWGYRDTGANALLRLNLHKGFEYNVGYDLQRYNARDEVWRINDLTETTHALFGQVRTTDDLLRNARFAAGLRYNKPSKADASTIWNISGQFDLPQAMFVRANLGTAFRLPDAEALFLSEPGEVQGNPDLKPERSRNLNLSVGGSLASDANSLGWELIGFAREITDLISDDGVTFINVGDKVKTRGLQLAVNLKLDEWLLIASHTVNRTRNSGSDEQIIEVPEQLSKLVVEYQPRALPLGINASLSYVGTVFDSVSGFGRIDHGDYAVVNLGAHYTAGERRQHRLQVNIDNVLDREYAASLGAATPDDGGDSYVYWNRGVPRTFKASYTWHY